MIITLRCVGIDVSKHHLDIFDEGIGVSERVANAPHAIAELVARWRCDALVVFEATGVYDLELREAPFYAKLRQAGKPAKLALIAVARKLLIILNAIMRDRKAYMPAQQT